jgi:hypothetical protein
MKNKKKKGGKKEPHNIRLYLITLGTWVCATIRGWGMVFLFDELSRISQPIKHVQ